MSGDSTLPRELLRDSEATLRIVDALLVELREAEPDSVLESSRVGQLLDELTARPTGVSALPGVLIHAVAEVSAALEALRVSRGVLERAAGERVQLAQATLQQVSSATEVAVADIMTGLDHAVHLTDRLEGMRRGGDREVQRLHGELRAELFRLMGCIQVQDGSAHQLRYAAGLLGEIDGRLTAVAALANSLPAHFAASPAAGN